jgi:hypothetical protein
MPPTKPHVQVQSTMHFLDLIRRGKRHYRLEAIVQPSGELRGTDVYADIPSVNHGYAQGAMVTDNFGYDIIMRVLEDKGEKWDAQVYCPGDWSAHDVAAEIEKWGV